MKIVVEKDVMRRQFRVSPEVKAHAGETWFDAKRPCITTSEEDAGADERDELDAAYVSGDI